VTFATDSIPAIFGITRDTFLIYTSNAFAILGLRALYFLLAGLLDYLRYLEIGLAAVLLFIGGKMVVEPWWKMSVQGSLGVVAGLLVVTVAASVLAGRKVQGEEK
jgi:tellurite resistance protein TerC